MARGTGNNSTRSPRVKEGPCGKLPLPIQKHLANATQAELKALDGIGTKAAELIVDATGSAHCFESWEQVVSRIVLCVLRLYWVDVRGQRDDAVYIIDVELTAL